MSTRAIIGYRKADGTFIGGWQWCDGGDMLPILRKYFDTKEKVDSLISMGVWTTLISPKDSNLNVFKEWESRPNSEYKVLDIEKCHVLTTNYYDVNNFLDDYGVIGIENGAILFNTIQSASHHDINYVYEFIPVGISTKWRKHSGIIK